MSRAVLLALLLATPAFSRELYQHGAVASGHPAASRAGAEVLAQGGNAVDAAVASILAMGIARPDSSGLGGGGFMVYRRASDGRTFALDFREVAPAAARRDMFVQDGRVVPRLSEDGGLAIAVPGEIAGLARMHAEHGHLPWRQVLAVPRDLAAQGPEITPAMHQEFADAAGYLRRWPALARRYLPNGQPPAVGTRLPNPTLAATIDTLAREGAVAFYRGRFARAIVRATREAGGILTEEDLAAYRPTPREPLHGSYRGYEIWSMPPPSSGGGVLLEVLNILDAIPGWPPKDAGLYNHQLVEAMKHGFADRAQYYGDPSFVKVPIATLTSTKHAAGLAARIGQRALPIYRYGVLQLPADAGTSHFSVIDADGNAVAATSTVNLAFGSKVYVPELGLVLNNEMDDFASAPGVPNAFGLVGGEANAVAPGKRPLSSMTPTILVKDGRVAMVTGASGGSRIISGTLQSILNVVHHGMDAAGAVAAPRVHHQWKPDSVRAEAAVGAAVLTDLRSRGHTVTEGGAGSSVEALVVLKDGVSGGDDPRKGGAPAGPVRLKGTR